jgi:hypothetical protein
LTASKSKVNISGVFMFLIFIRLREAKLQYTKGLRLSRAAEIYSIVTCPLNILLSGLVSMTHKQETNYIILPQYLGLSILTLVSLCL